MQPSCRSPGRWPQRSPRAGLSAGVRAIEAASSRRGSRAETSTRHCDRFLALASYDPDFLRPVFGSGRSPLNESGYASKRFDRIAAEVASAADEEARRGAVERELALLKAAPAVALYFPDPSFGYLSAAHRDWVFVKGKGPLDKLSFLPQEVGPGPALTQEAGEQGQAFPLLGALAVALGAAALLLVAAALRGRR